jgi:hypothetical protein
MPFAWVFKTDDRTGSRQNTSVQLGGSADIAMRRGGLLNMAIVRAAPLSSRQLLEVFCGYSQSESASVLPVEHELL